MEQRVRLLGSPQVQDGSVWHDAPLDKRLGLLAHLACAEGWVTRERLSYLFWPDVSSAQARINLRQLLARTRALPYASSLEAEAQRLRWPVTCDVGCFRRALARANWPEAVALYRGDLLAGLELDDAGEFAHWLEFEREQLREAFRQAALRQADDALAADRPAEAARLFELLLAQDALDESVVQRYLALLAARGERQEARRVYRSFAARLEAELGLEPSAATLRLLNASPRPEPVPAEPQPLAAPRRPAMAAPLTSFVGRELELADIERRLTREPCRLLTILGPGGVGKTRLALRAAEALKERFEVVVSVPLETLRTPEVLPLALAAQLGLELRGPGEALEQVIEQVGERELLVVLDNFEHLLPGALLVHELLARCPRLRVLVTSRERLRLSSEWLLPLAGLPVPPEAALRPEEALRYDALQLFGERARQVAPAFRLDARTVPEASRLCRMLDGLPLGLELAAAWLRTLDLDAVTAALQSSLSALSSDAQDASERHRSLRAAFEHSWRLLSKAEQRAFRRLAVFRGGFDRAAAKAVTGAAAPLLAALVDKSLLRAAEGRFGSHPLLYQFMGEQLAADPDEAERLRDAHARYFLKLLASWRSRLHGPQQPQMLAQFTPELSNLRAAWFWGLGRGWAAECGAALEPLILFHGIQGRFSEGAQLFAESVARFARSDAQGQALQGALRVNLAWFLSNLARFDEAVAEAEAGLRLLGSADPWGGRCRGHSILGSVAARRGELDEARALFRQALEAARATRDNWAVALVAGQLGLLELNAGRLEAARALFEAALAENEGLGNTPGIVNNLDYLGQLSLRVGDADAAVRHFERGLALSEESRFRLRVPYLRTHLAAARLAQGDRAAAAEEGALALEVARESGQRALQAEALLILGRAAARPERARAALLGALELAWALKELPRVLAVLLELASLPGAGSRSLATLVSLHPATPAPDRQRAAALLGGAAPAEPLPALEEAVAALLAEGGVRG